MSRTYCNFINKSTDRYVVVTGFRGTDWVTTEQYIGTPIGPGDQVEVGAMGDPGRDETDHWGWIFLEDQTTGLPLQLYLRITFGFAKDQNEMFAGVAAPEGSQQDAPNPAPWDAAFEIKRGESYTYDPLPRRSAADGVR